MFKSSVIISVTTLMGWSSAQACTLMPLEDPETGRKFNFSYPASTPKVMNFSSEGSFAAVIKAKSLKKTKAEYGNHKNVKLRHKIINVINGDISSFPDREYPFDPDLKSSEPMKGFGFDFWEAIRLPKQTTHIGAIVDSCGGSSQRTTMKPKEHYLVLGRKGSDGIPYIQQAVPLSSPSDKIVGTLSKVIKKTKDAPNKFTPQEYFSNIKGYAEISILECPKQEDFRFEDSRFATVDKQYGTLYQVEDAFNVRKDTIDFQKFNSYQNQINNYSHRENSASTACAYGHRYLMLKSRYNKYLAITQGRIDTGHIKTNIEITGNSLINVADIKSWIRNGNSDVQ